MSAREVVEWEVEEDVWAWIGVGVWEFYVIMSLLEVPLSVFRACACAMVNVCDGGGRGGERR